MNWRHKDLLEISQLDIEAREEGAHPQGQERRPLFRGAEHEDQDLLRHGRQAPLGRHVLPLGLDKQPDQGRKPQGHRAHPPGHAPRRHRHPARLQRRGPVPCRAAALQHSERRGRVARPSHPGPARRLHPEPALAELPGQKAAHPGRHRPQQGRPLRRPALHRTRGHGQGLRAQDAAAKGHRELARGTLHRAGKACDGVDAIVCLRLQLERQQAGLLPDVREYARTYGLGADTSSGPTPGSRSCTPDR
jgi:hypothetical protein